MGFSGLGKFSSSCVPNLIVNLSHQGGMALRWPQNFCVDPRLYRENLCNMEVQESQQEGNSYAADLQ